MFNFTQLLETLEDESSNTKLWLIHSGPRVHEFIILLNQMILLVNSVHRHESVNKRT